MVLDGAVGVPRHSQSLGDCPDAGSFATTSGPRTPGVLESASTRATVDLARACRSASLP